MRIAHVTAYCHAGSSGGTERYVQDLILGLNQLGHENEILWMNPGRPTIPAEPSDIPIRILPRSDMRVDEPPPALADLAREIFIGAGSPQVLHFHTFGRSEAVLAALAVRERVPYVFTYHSPAWTCRRETLLRWGEDPCDGEVRALRCAACKVQERLQGSAWAGYAAAILSSLAGPLFPSGSSPWHRRLAFTSDTAAYRASVRAFLAACDQAVACAEWSIPVLQVNGASSDRILHLPQGVPGGFRDHACAPTRMSSDLFTVGYIGRMNEVKGIHILIEAFRRTRYAQARLKVYGWSDAPQLAAYGRVLRQLAGDDPRIEFIAEKSPAEMPEAYAGLSLLAIPSVWMETGPLTLLEALQSGVPVYGSARIGQRALLEQYGQVIEPNSPAAWAHALESAFARHARGRWMPVQLQQPLLTMADVAARMTEVYERVVA